ncbi:MAG: TetR/AcrR family transcriptional regulator [gamma proteobacterium symbiont of Taylorina sp.]|nr:TetR/AcrR family transcriptional regulator [gamma proteobacterium symbiont of Taylorina sp.]
MARTKSFDEKKVLGLAMLLFWKKGYSATSMKDLEHVMELKPTSIYNAYGNKRELFVRALNLYLQSALVGFIESLEGEKSVKTALNDVLNETIHLHFNKSHPGGCMVVLSLLESEQHDTKTKKILDSALFLLRDSIAKRIKQGQETGEINREINCRVIANHVTALITGMITMAKAGFSKKELEELIFHSSCNLLK